MTLPTFKYGINNLLATQHPPEQTDVSLQMMYQSYITQTRHDNNTGNWSFTYTINSDSQDFIEKNGWEIKKIYSFSAFNPKEIVFDIVDPFGIGNKDLNVLRRSTGAGAEYFIAFKGLYIEALNEGLRFFNKASQYSSWYNFIISKDAGEFTTETFYAFEKQQNQDKATIARLESEKNNLQLKIENIRELCI